VVVRKAERYGDEPLEMRKMAIWLKSTTCVVGLRAMLGWP
jgi:hypothetical protein